MSTTTLVLQVILPVKNAKVLKERLLKLSLAKQPCIEFTLGRVITTQGYLTKMATKNGPLNKEGQERYITGKFTLAPEREKPAKVVKPVAAVTSVTVSVPVKRRSRKASAVVAQPPQVTNGTAVPAPAPTATVTPPA